MDTAPPIPIRVIVLSGRLLRVFHRHKDTARRARPELRPPARARRMAPLDAPRFVRARRRRGGGGGGGGCAGAGGGGG